MTEQVTGIDIGGTHITVCKIDLGTRQFLESSRIRLGLDPSQSAENIIETWAAAIKACSDKHGSSIGRIGIAMPGPFDYEKGVSLIRGLHKYESLYGLNVKELLAIALDIPATHIRMMNDATAFLQGEWKAGSGKGCSKVVGLTLGTGLGSASCFSNAVEDGDLYCMPYRLGRAEDYLCARWFINTYQEMTGSRAANVKELAVKAGADEAVASLFEQFGYTLGEVLVKRYGGNFPEHIIVGGNIGKSLHLFQSFCDKVIQQHGLNTRFLPAELGEDAALIGAALLWEA